MTPEEAGERLLSGNAFVECSDCAGRGKAGPVLIGHSLCAPCEGAGTLIDPDYAEACSLLGRTPPRNIQGLWKQSFNALHIQTSLQKMRPDTLRLNYETRGDLKTWAGTDDD